MSSTDAPSSEALTRILFVPGDLLALEFGESFLDRASLELREAAGWDDALELFERWKPHLIVLRNHHDRDAARAFCHAVRARARARTTRLLMITDRLEGVVHDETDLCCDAHLVSPVPVEQLLGTMAELLDVRQRRSARVPLDVLVHAEGFASDGTAVDAALATAVMLGEDGMLVESSRQLAIGASGRLQFFLPQQSERLAVEARVLAAVDEVSLIYALEFVDLAPQHRAAIRRYVESRREAA